MDSPENITYNFSTIDLNVSTNATLAEWMYSLNGGPNVSFIPNTTFVGPEGTNNFTVYLNASDTNVSLYGIGIYGAQLYGFAEPDYFQAASEIIWFTVQAKRFLMEIYITFEFMAFYLLLRGLKRSDQLVNTLLAMGLFFALAVTGIVAEQIGSNTVVFSQIAVFGNLGMGLLSLGYLVLSYLDYFREQSDVMNMDNVEM